MQFPTLYSIQSSGSILEWKIWTEENVIHTQYGLQKGKKQHTTKTITEGKNKGRANSTTPTRQAELEAESMHNKKINRSGYLTKEGLIDVQSSDVPDYVSQTPMLATMFGQCAAPKFPDVYIQPKIDGIRVKTVIMNGEVHMYTRTNKEIMHMTHIIDSIRSSSLMEYECLVLDGELYSTELTFEECSGACRNESEQHPLMHTIKICVFDCVFGKGTSTFIERYSMLKAIELPSSLYLIDTRVCESETDLHHWHDRYVAQGFEGIMVRNAKGVYKGNGYRSPHLQKLKYKQDSEYKIVDYKEGKGKLEHTVIWRCETQSGDQFDVTPCGTIESRKELLLNAEHYIGKMLTVEYQELSAKGIPRFPIGKVIRDYE